MYRHVHHMPHERAMDVIPRYEPDHYRPRDISSPSPARVKHHHPYKPDHPTDKELEVKIPERKTIKSEESTELLQVVPKTRDCEEKHIPAPTGTSSPVEDDREPPKKSLLESICSSLKKESSEWTEENLNEEEELGSDLKVKEEIRIESNHHQDTVTKDSIIEDNLTQLKDELLSRDPRQHNRIAQNSEEQRLRERITDDQLERRRRSNREAQRRRRARLKMQGHDGRAEYVDEVDAKEKEQIEMRHCEMSKNRPDSLYTSPYHDVYHHSHRGSSYHTERFHEHYMHEKYAPRHHMNQKPQHHPYHHPPPPPPPPHYIYEPSTDYLHRGDHVSHHYRHHPHHPHHSRYQRDEYSPRPSPTPTHNIKEQIRRNSATVTSPRETQQKGKNLLYADQFFPLHI